ncbi:hypothetical protein IRJ41_022345 [Triplophysa rosa]|uniref:Fibroblast growth factor 23 n=1 Tax=Triplophysa rosa TaxID=992332 RepID=A0A9W7X1S5_TRIRA|nr:hypothetical protein IRJ41_022345 [Triplophysa rosa]
MHTVYTFCMAVLGFCTLVVCYPIQSKEDITTDNQKDQYTEKISHLKLTFSNGKRKVIYQDSKGGISLRTRSKDCFSVDIKSNLFMCLDSNKQPYILKDKIPTEVYLSLQTNLYLRHRRSQHVDPSDPLGSENPRSKTANYRRPNREPEREHISNVSKETITSCDDPLHVLLSKSPVSPHLRKEKKQKQVAPS